VPGPIDGLGAYAALFRLACPDLFNPLDLFDPLDPLNRAIRHRGN
jgi:hypothetical protein